MRYWGFATNMIHISFGYTLNSYLKGLQDDADWVSTSGSYTVGAWITRLASSTPSVF